MGVTRTINGLLMTVCLLFSFACAPKIKSFKVPASNSQPLSLNVLTVPSNPTQVMAEALIEGARIYFDAPHSDGGLPITRYFIYRGDQTLLGEGTSSPIEIRSLNSNELYDFFVVAQNAIGDSLPSDLSNSVMPIPLNGVPDAPNLDRVEAQSLGAKIFYSPPQHEGNSIVFSYRVEIENVGLFDFTRFVPSIDVLGLDFYRGPYRIRIYAENSSGIGPPSAWSDPFSPLSGVPAAPTITQVTTGVRSANITIEPPQNNGGLPITGYLFSAMSSHYPVIEVTTSSPSVNISGLHGGFSYTFGVRAINANGPGSIGFSQATPLIEDTEPMPVGRYRHASVVLNDGRILITGGVDSSDNPLSSAYLFNPSNGLIEQMLQMNSPRLDHSMVRLNSGKVLILGGSSSLNVQGLLTQAELFDPLNRSFTTLSSQMNQPRRGGAMALLSNGRVFICGGSNAQGSLNFAEYYIPETELFVPLSSQMSVARVNHTATFIPGVNRVVIVGGSSNSGVLSTAEVFNLSNETFNAAGVMGRPRMNHSATLLMNGKILIAGGHTGMGPTKMTEIFDPFNPSFFDLNPPELPMPRMYHTGTLLSDGKVLLAGGNDAQNTLSSTYDIYDPVKKTIVVIANNQRPRVLDSANFVNGQIVFVGGKNTVSNTVHSNVELYGFVSETFSPTLSVMATSRHGHTQTLLPSGKVLITGGSNSNGPLSSAELYDPMTKIFTLISGDMAFARTGHAASLLPNGKVLITGGMGAGLVVHDSVEIYDPSTNNFIALPLHMNFARVKHTSTTLINGKILIVGGYGSGSVLAAEIYDYSTNQFTVVGSTSSDRYHHSATLLYDGRVLISGHDSSQGIYFGSDVPPRLHEVYDPVTNLFTPLSISTSQHGLNQAVLLDDGRVFFSESSFNSNYGSIDPYVYDPVMNSTIPTGQLLGMRMNHTATLLGNGDVVILGGSDGAFPDVNLSPFVKLYRPSTNATRTISTSMLTNRFGHQSTLLLNGDVLITGGHHLYPEAPLNTAELYHP